MKFNQLTYKRPKLKDLKIRLESIVASLNKANNFDGFWKSYQNYQKEDKEINTLVSLVFIRNALDTRDKFYDAEKKYIVSILPELSRYTSKIEKLLIKSPFRSQLEDKLGSYYFDRVEVSLKTFSEDVIEDIKEENLLVIKYQKLISSAKIEYKGIETNLSGLLPHMQSPNRNIRREASELYYSFMSDSQESFDILYDKLVKVRDKIAKKLGYKNFIELGYYRMGRTDYNAKDVARYRKFILDEVVPPSNKLRQEQKKRLRLDKLNYYDLNFEFLSGNAKLLGSKDDIMVEAQKMYDELSDETGKFFRMMVENELLDLDAKIGKAPGGFCDYLFNYEYPFVSSNFNGTQSDIKTLTHEIGHAFQKYCSKDLDSKLLHGTKEVAEIHSSSMEFFTYPWMKNFFGKDTDKFKYSHLKNIIFFLPYGASVDEFQHFVYEYPDIGPAERRRAWRDIEKKYTPYKDYTENLYLEEGGYWQRQTHIYNEPFYYIDYTLAQICALQYYKRYNENPEATWQSYVKLCSLGGSKAFTDLLTEVELDSPFQEGILKEIMEFVKNELDKLDTSHF